MIATRNEPLFEKYRPRDFAEVVGQPKALAVLDRLRARGGLSGRAYWLAGKSGTGKTSIARLIAGEIADEFCVEEIDATDLTGARIRELERGSHTYGLAVGGKSGRAYIVNEAHGLRKNATRQLLTTLERIPGHVVWIFTTTKEGHKNLFDEQLDAGPLTSRCVEVPMVGSAAAFAERAREIALAENLDGKPLASYRRLVNDRKQNLRAVLQEIEAGAMLAD